MDYLVSFVNMKNTSKLTINTLLAITITLNTLIEITITLFYNDQHIVWRVEIESLETFTDFAITYSQIDLFNLENRKVSLNYCKFESNLTKYK